jgi:NADH-quinone oxidoreductase subunit E
MSADTFAFDEQSEALIPPIIAKYPPGRQASAVLPLLYVVQDQMKRATGSAWVPRVAMDAVAHRLGMPPIRVYEVATFYLMFNTAPIGRWPPAASSPASRAGAKPARTGYSP